MLKSEDIICISSIDWDFIWQGHQEIMTRFARNGNRVLYIENTGVRTPTIKDIGRIKSRLLNWKKGVHGIRKIEDGLYVYSPLVLPFPYLKIARFINKKLMFSVLFRWLKAVGFKEPVVWTFLPTGLTLDLVNTIEPKIFIYYCIDSFQSSSADARKIKASEELTIKRADLVFATSIELLNHCKKHNKNVYYFPFGVNIDNFINPANRSMPVPQDIKGVKKPIAGYVGGLHKWVDFDLFRELALELEELSFVLCGPIQTDDAGKIKGLKNVFLLGQKKAEELPLYVENFDVCLIPYRITDYTKNVYPTKLNEYLSLGKRVVSTKLPEVVKFNHENSGVVNIAGENKDFINKVKECIAMPVTEDERLKAVNAAKKNSWQDRVKEMSGLIEEYMARIGREKDLTWKDTFTRAYRTTQKKIIPALIGAAIAYFVVFYSPLIWIIAKPLEYKSTLDKVDVIAVLGGGVGESGKVGQGYESRVDTAVSLYKDGYARRVLYLSGYKDIMKEAEVMKALSVFLGVADGDIFIDEEASNTYQMAMDIKEWLKGQRFNSAIIVSSPYHMKRLALICRKHLAEEKIFFVPVKSSSFYQKGQKVTAGQWRGIIQEYIAILYYMYKGYI